MATTGRPRKELDWDEFKKLCELHCTRREVAQWFQVSEDTIDRRCLEEFDLPFASYYEENKVGGKISLRRRQFEKAMDGDTSMLIWLGKNWLDQKDKVEDTDNRLPIKIELVKSTDEA